MEHMEWVWHRMQSHNDSSMSWSIGPEHQDQHATRANLQGPKSRDVRRRTARQWGRGGVLQF